MTKIRTIDYIDEFTEALRNELIRAEGEWGDTWLRRPRLGQERRFMQWFMDMYDKFRNGGQRFRWEAIAGEALIGWVREQHPELFARKKV